MRSSLDLLLGRKTVECLKFNASFDAIKAVLEETASNYMNTSLRIYEDPRDGIAQISINSNFTPKLLDDFIVERIARATPLYPRTILSSVMTDRESASSGMLNGSFGPKPILILEHTDDYTVIEYDLDDLDVTQTFDKSRAFGYQAVALAAAAAGINLQYEPEPMMTVRDGVNAIKKAFADWEKVPKKEWEQRAEKRALAGEEAERKEKEERQKIIEEAKKAVVDGVAQGKYESCNEARADLDFKPDIIAAAWRQTKKERAEAYWSAHSADRIVIDATVSRLKSDLASSKHRESSYREELASLTGFFKGRKRQELAANIEMETSKQEELQKQIAALNAKFETMPE